MKVLGIDQSLNATGVCVLDGDKVVTAFVIKHKKLTGIEKLVHIKQNIKAIIEMEKPDVAAMEDYAYAGSGRVFQLGEVGGIIKLTIYEHKIPLIILNIQNIKRFATGNPKASKEDMMAAAKAIKRMKYFDDDNIADAFHIARLAQTQCQKH